MPTTKAVTRRSRHTPAVLPPDVAAQEALLDSLLELPPIPGPKGWSDDVERAALRRAFYGSDPVLALAATGIPRRTASDWLSETPPEPYRHACAALGARLKQVEGIFEAGCLERIRTAGHDSRHWTANAWLLERKYPMYRLQYQGDSSERVVINIGQLNVGSPSRMALPEPVIEADVLPAPEPIRLESVHSRVTE